MAQIREHCTNTDPYLNLLQPSYCTAVLPLTTRSQHNAFVLAAFMTLSPQDQSSHVDHQPEPRLCRGNITNKICHRWQHLMTSPVLWSTPLSRQDLSLVWPPTLPR